MKKLENEKFVDVKDILKRKSKGELNTVLMEDYGLTYEELRKILDRGKGENE